MMRDRRESVLSLYALTLMMAILIYPMIIGELRGEAWRILLFAAIAFLAILFSALAALFSPLIALRACEDDHYGGTAIKQCFSFFHSLSE